MFVWECLKTEGQHLGMCMDGFMFGSCCVHDTADNMISQQQQLTTSKVRQYKLSKSDKNVNKMWQNIIADIKHFRAGKSWQLPGNISEVPGHHNQHDAPTSREEEDNI